MPKFEILRSSHVVQGFVCPQWHHEKCKALPSMFQHGIHGNEWLYEVRSPGVGGMHVQVYTPCKPDHVPERVWKTWSGGFLIRGVVYHCPWSLSRADVLHSSLSEGCRLAEPCRASCEVSSVEQDALLRLLDRERFEQPEAFWQKVELLFEHEVACAIEVRKCGLERCTACDGTGIVFNDVENVGGT